MVSYSLAFTWGLVILTSFTGWGTVLNRVLFPSQRLDWGQRAAWGVALSVVAGGALDLLQWISRTAVLTYIGLGIVWWVAGLVPSVREWRQGKPESQTIVSIGKQRLAACGFVLLAVMALSQYAGSVSTPRHEGPLNGTNFNAFDDFQAYVLFPAKMLQLGSLGRDPFNGRRLESSLGGQSFLHTFVLAALSFQNLHLLDPGLSLLLVIGVLWGNFKERGFPLAYCVGLLFFFLIVPPPTINISSLCIGLALFLSLYRTLAWSELQSSPFLSRTLIVALITSALCALKSSFIPVGAGLLVCSFFCYARERGFRRWEVLEAAGTALLCFAFTLPWMISTYRSSGTLLYPLLGKGYHQSAYGNAESPNGGLVFSQTAPLILRLVTDSSFVALGLLTLAYLLSRPWKIEGREPCTSLIVGAAFGTFAIALATGGETHLRLAFPFIQAATLATLMEVLSLRPAGSRNFGLLSPSVLAIIAAVLVVGSTWDNARVWYADCFRSIRAGTRNSTFIPEKVLDRYKHLQISVPPGQAVLAWLDEPFLMDFRRNTIFAVDLPGEASPAPGMPLSKGGEALARYLVSKTIRYVAYSYGDGAGIPPDLAQKPMPSGVSPWRRSMYTHIFDFQVDLQQLAKTRNHIYDDGQNFVLDLQQPVE
jgi:hypothetical protein